ncbi:hypothetical protein [Bacillus cereus group sp. TH152-1LC]|uniref:hypothetical protein n=1 Tax=Bacillus cereus group sp. TH152-1LC TaxID=3018060 RepID=UPI0022E3A364|nr:hypothetical protein [Bacillus cereus group sp. TH152-1LC]MDA1675503.1 hypothetical protein [Bacillus cereus group sp. TH152-1LC]
MAENTRKIIVVEALAEVYKQLFGKKIDEFQLEDKLEVMVSGDWDKLTQWFVYVHEKLDVSAAYMPFKEKEKFHTFQDAVTYFEDRVKEEESTKKGLL